MSISRGAVNQSGTRRDAIVAAMIQVAGEKGYADTAVADVIAEAGASRTTFYKHFSDKRECFLAAYDVAVEKTLATAELACAEGNDWPDRVRRALTAVVELFAAEPALGRTAIVEVASAGPDARQRYSAAIDRLSRLLESGRRSEPALPPTTSLMAVGAVAGLILDELRGNRSGSLLSLLPELEFALLVPYLGPQTASEAFVATTSAGIS